MQSRRPRPSGPRLEEAEYPKRDIKMLPRPKPIDILPPLRGTWWTADVVADPRERARAEMHPRGLPD